MIKEEEEEEEEEEYTTTNNKMNNKFNINFKIWLISTAYCLSFRPNNCCLSK